MGAELDIFIDLQARRIVPGVASSGPVDLTFYQDDTYHIVLHGLVPDDAAPLGTIYSPAPISYTAVAAGLFAGGADASPLDGTWKVSFDGETTPSLKWNVGKGELAGALNALGTVATAGGVKVLESGPGHFYTIQWLGPTPAAQFEIVENELSPVCLPRIRTNPAVVGQVLIKLVRVPLAFTDEFELPLPPPVTIEPVRAGNTQRNEIQSVVIPAQAAGEFALTFNSTASQVVPVDEATSAEIARVLNELYADGVSRFLVTNPSRGRFYVEFVGPLAKADQPLLAVEMFSQTPLPTPKLSLPITAEVPVDLELLARDRIPIVLEIAAWNGAEKTVLAHQPVALVNNAIDSGLAEELEQSGAVMTRTHTVYIDNTESTPIVIAAPGAVYTPAEAAEELVIEHSLNTFHPDVRVHYKVSTAPEEWVEIPDDQYEATATTANHVKVIGLPLSADPDDVYYVGRWKLFVASPDATVKVLEHTHPTTEVFEGAKTLAVILDELRASLPTDWPNIPANKIVGQLLATQISITSVAEALQTNARFVTTLQEVFTANSTVISTIATLLGENEIFTKTLIELFETSTELQSAVVTSLVNHTEFRTAVLTALQLGAGTITSTIPFIITPLEDTVPAVAGPLPFTMDGTIDLGDIEGYLPRADVTNGRRFYTANSNVYIPPRKLKTFKAGALIYSTGEQWFGGEQSGGNIVLGTTTAFVLESGAYIPMTFADDPPVVGQWVMTMDGSLVRITEVGVNFLRVSPRVAGNPMIGSDVVLMGTLVQCTEFDKELFTISVTEAMLAESTQFVVSFAVTLSLIGNCEGHYRVMLRVGHRSSDFGTTNLDNIVWDTTIIDQQLVVTDAAVTHAFSYRVTNSASNVRTATKTVYTKASDSVAPTEDDFIVQARLYHFDAQNVESPMGQLVRKMSGVASIVKTTGS